MWQDCILTPVLQPIIVARPPSCPHQCPAGAVLQVTCLTLGANVTDFAAKNVLKLLPSSNSTALEVDLQVRAVTDLTASDSRRPNGQSVVLAVAAKSGICCFLQLFGEDVVPFTGPKQTLLLTTVQQLLPRLFNGIGSRWARITKVSHSVAAKTVNVTMLAATSSVPKYYEQVRSFPPSSLAALCCGVAPA
jgi:hypothetical protein